ncbi:MAG: plasmid pRiA4b ORF-3 family protein, partial [Anaerolineales bacterium]|nr:plasmid pRiA4b ORF-3 family protein [Anaerolineales bacterium]
MPTPKSIYQIKVTLNDSKPPIWRRILVADTTTLIQLHAILQMVMGWTDYHLHMFTINGQIYGDPQDDEYGDMGTKNESRFKLNQLVGREGFKFRYEYDFGDSWLHDLVVEKILPADPSTGSGGAHYPVCVAGKRACPPEDSGGVWGYKEILEARTNPKHPQHREYKEWIGENFDPERFDLNEVNESLHHPRKSREAEEQDFYQPAKVDSQSAEKIVAWENGLTKDQLAWADSLAARRDMVTILNYLKNNRVVGTQST